MLRGALAYMIVVLVLGTFAGWSNSQNPDSPLHQPYIAGYVFYALLWGSLFINGFIRSLHFTVAKRIILMVGLAAAAAGVAYFYYSTFADGEMTTNLLAGWGDDPSTYKEYPIKGYELTGLLFFVMYIVVGFAQWVLSLASTTKNSQISN